ncbi:MAG: tRNA (adenosine(37)-N6)-threonylcarbamoyltransferase complex dimerization subunit type 1 TsaB, partial [Candidatus Omnitrophota bacterium]
MKTLAFDTSTKFLSIALFEDDTVKTEYHEDVGISHSEILVSTIKDMLERIEWKFEDIDLVCVGLGPGSFTGLRIAAATVKGFSAVLNNKLVGVPTMDAMVLNFPSEAKRVAPLLDARKGKVYSCIYERDESHAKRITDYLLITIDELLANLEEEVYFYGDGVIKYEEKLKQHPLAKYDKDADWYPRAAQIGQIGIRRVSHMVDDPEVIEPLYLHSKECNI